MSAPVRGRTPGLVVAVAALAFLFLAAAPAAVTSAGGSPVWAPAATASIHPGVQTVTGSNQCTADFVFQGTTDTYVGQAAHCASTQGNNSNGCTTASMPIGTPVSVGGASRPGTMVYSSWLTMQARAETDSDACLFNDFALVRLDPVDVANVNPSVPFWGGPTGLNSTGTLQGQAVYSYGNSEFRVGLTQLSPKKGISMGDAGQGWSHVVHTVTPGIPGDSGSAFLDPAGNALGVLSTINIGGLGGAGNGVTDLSRALDYLHTRTSMVDVQPVLGTTPFQPDQLPLG